MKEPLVSIVIPCYNAAETLENTLNSVMAQDYSNYEVILIDDGSTDNTFDIINKYENSDSRFKSLRQENKGVSSARNNGVSVASSEFVAFLDSDDVFYKNSISNRMKALLEANDSDLLGVFCPVEMIFEDGTSMGLPLLFNYLNLPNNRLYFSYSPQCTLALPIVKREKYIQSGGQNEALNLGEDYLLWHAMMRTGGYFKFVSTCKIGYTQHPASIVHTDFVENFKHWKQSNNLIFSEDYRSIPECRNGFGGSLQSQCISDRAFNTSIMAISLGLEDVARNLSADISRYAISMKKVSELEFHIKFNSLRALCKPESEWEKNVWPAVKDNVLNFITDLESRFGDKCHVITELREKLEKIGHGKYIIRIIKYLLPNNVVEVLSQVYAVWLNYSQYRTGLIFLLLSYTSLLVLFSILLTIYFLR